MISFYKPWLVSRRDPAGHQPGGDTQTAVCRLGLALALGAGAVFGATAAALEPPGQATAASTPDASAVQQVFRCMSEGLPESWQHSWVIATETMRSESSREFEAVFRYAETETDTTGRRFLPCGSETLPADIIRINATLARQWREIRLDFYRDGRFELRYDNPR